ncbi:MAG: DNA polymerase III subunit beta [Eubacteriales bacterium]|nr:DNA polymerase III subunit beta [Eubacteriales bacterium]
MKLIFEKKSFLDSIIKVQRASSQRTTLPILECILIDAKNNNIFLSSSDNELFIKKQVEGKIEEKGSVAIESKMLLDIIKKMPEDEDIIINVNENKKCIISSGKIEYKIMGKEEENFPPLPKFDKEINIDINEFTFKNIVNQTIFSVATNELNKTLTGECIEIEKNILKIISLDGFRVSIRKLVLDKEYNKIKKIVPAKTLQEVSRIIDGNVENNIKIYLSENNIAFEFKNTIIVSNIINGEFFDINKIINDDYTTKIKINRKELLESLDRFMIFSNEKKPVILEIKQNILNLTLQSLVGELKENIQIQKSGNDLMIGFNSKLILDALKVIDDEIINMYFTNSKTPCYINDKENNEKNNDYSYLYLILPTNIIKN